MTLAKKAASKTSDYNAGRAMEFEAMNNIIPQKIAARAANTDMYNKTLLESKASAEQYAGVRNEVANQNNQMIVADRARKNALEAGKNVADTASLTNYMDNINRSNRLNREYKIAGERSTETQRLQTEFSEKMKPFKTKYELLSDPKNSNTYKEFDSLVKSGMLTTNDWNSLKPGTVKTWKQFSEDELKQAEEAYSKQVETLRPFYASKFNSMNIQSPNLITIKRLPGLRSGGTLTGQERIEIENIRAKLKRNIENDKNFNKSLDRKQREVEKILNGLSKETFFLLKTVLGK